MQSKILLGNLPSGTTADDVKQRFAKLGAEVEVEIVDEGNPDKLDAIVLINVNRDIARDMAQRAHNEFNWGGRRISIYVPVLIKNAIVLIEEIDQQIESGIESFKAILDSAVSRMRPVMMAAATTILGMIPLLSDVFFVNMAIIVMAGLAFASVLTLVFVPVMYAILFRINYRQEV